MPSGLGHSPVERRPPAVFCCSSWASHKDLIYIIFAFKPRRRRRRRRGRRNQFLLCNLVHTDTA